MTVKSHFNMGCMIPETAQVCCAAHMTLMCLCKACIRWILFCASAHCSLAERLDVICAGDGGRGE